MKRKRRRVGPGEVGYYHLMSRTAGGEMLFGDREKEVLRGMLWKVADFSGVRVVTYALMGNHFHLLVEVPPAGEEVPDAELVRRYRALYPEPTPWRPLGAEALAEHLRRDTELGKAMRSSLRRRMHDVSWLMKTLKQRFSLWYNRGRERRGTLWEGRFAGVLVEGEPHALRTVAAYVDLNAVRAGLAADPKDYRFCGYGEAMGGSRRARRGLEAADKDLAGYRRTLYGVGSEAKEGKACLGREEALRVIETQKGKVPLAAALRCRVRYFSEGWALGSPEFVREVARAEEPGRKRPPRPHPMEGADWGGLAVLSGMRKDLFG